MDYWTENGIEKPQQIVVAAACKAPGWSVILVGARHWDKVMRLQLKYMDTEFIDTFYTSEFEQGFIDQFGEFLTREQAMDIVKANGQKFDIERNGGSDKELYSEGLY